MDRTELAAKISALGKEAKDNGHLTAAVILFALSGCYPVEAEQEMYDAAVSTAEKMLVALKDHPDHPLRKN